jgi:multimeric flavodoxin WrbA
MVMKVLGLNFGRDKQQCEKFLAQALDGAAKAGAQTELVRMCMLDIQRCMGCGACSRGWQKEGKQCRCIIKDDFQGVMEKILDADAIIVAAPVYVLAPTGMFKDFVDRMGPAHDFVVMYHSNIERIAKGQDPIDPRALKRKYVAYISVGGARIQHWVSFGLPTMQTFGFPMHMKVVDQLDVYGAFASPARAEMFAGRALELGRNVASAIGQDHDSLVWPGEPGTCPVCHGNILTVLGESTKVECPICGISGELAIVDDEIKVTFSQEQQDHSRLNWGGLEDHYYELHVAPAQRAAAKE